jgi:hypothetical protein
MCDLGQFYCVNLQNAIDMYAYHIGTSFKLLFADLFFSLKLFYFFNKGYRIRF